MIKLLPENLRNQIAAGEVVERPASVIKELIENAIDAEATEISIKLQEGGIDLIEIQDNWIGMNKEDAEMSTKRYATSKIKQKEDLFNINTMWFRGEALASIASVSLFTMETKQEEALSGTKIEIHAWHYLPIQECAAMKGTKLIIKDLFDNIPARKKFLKSASTELKYCLEIVEDIAFMYPKVQFNLSNNWKEIIKLFKSENLKGRVSDILWSHFDKLIQIKSTFDFMEISGFISKPGEIFKTRKQKIFVNWRSIKDKTIAASVSQSYHSFLERGAYPSYYLFININSDLVDVNVHPRKSEVKFLRWNDVFSAVKSTIIDGFSAKEEIEELEIPKIRTQTFTQNKPRTSYNNSYSAPKSFNIPQIKQEVLEDSSFNFEQKTDTLNGYQIIGQTLNKFIILEKEDRVIFLDQHAVHERFRYDEFMKNMKNKTPQSQVLLLPEILEYSSKEFISINEQIEVLKNVWFELEVFGNNTFKITAIPVQIQSDEIGETVIKFCEELSETGESDELEGNIEKALTYLACRGSVMFGDVLNDSDLRYIVEKWIKHAKWLTCPHGRPLWFEINEKELEKKVGR